jgi:hypothetical protein
MRDTSSFISATRAIRNHSQYITSVVTLLLVSTVGHGEHIVAHARSNHTSLNKSVQDSQPVASLPKAPDTSKWKVYRNEKYGFQVKYPDTWTVSSSRGSSPEIIYFRGPNRGVIGRALNVAVQLNMNPRELGIEEWFAEQMRALDVKKVEGVGCSTVAGQPACFFEHADKSGKERFVYTLLHKTDVLSFDYKLGTEDSPSYAAIVDSFQPLN